MAIQPVPAMTPVPNFPALSERAAGTYNSSAYAFGTHMSVKFNGELLAVAMNVEHNAGEALAAVVAAQLARDQATVSAGDAETAMEEAQSARDAALAYAQAAQAASGVPTPTPSTIYAADASGVAGWRLASAIPAFAAKADKDGAVVTRMSTNRQAYTPAAGATQALDVSLAGEFQVTAAGALTLTFANVPAGNVSFVLTLDCVNFGGKIINWPAGNWIKADGSYATAVGNAGVTWQTAGTDTVLVWFKNGTPHYKVLR